MVLGGLRRAAAALVLACLGFLPDAALAKPQVLSGSVTYRERMALPPSAFVEVRLLDVSLADAPSVTLGRTTIRTGGRQVPIAYRLRYDDRRIRPGRSYALQARITAGGRLMFISTERHAVFTGGPETTDILVQRVGGEAAPAGGARGRM